jgi:DNA-directed RNA polymerase subunit RPC12/RpoP
MGMFDTITIECPNCHFRKSVQSKAGPCMMMIYTKENAPVEVLLDISRESIKCDECGEKFRLKFEYRTKIELVGDEESIWKDPNP